MNTATEWRGHLWTTWLKRDPQVGVIASHCSMTLHWFHYLFVGVQPWMWAKQQLEMSYVWTTKLVVFVFLCAHPLPHFALRSWSSLVAGNFSAAKLLDIRHQKKIDISGEGRETERIKHTIGRLLFSNQLKLIESPTLSQPTEDGPLGESSVPHLQNGTWGRQPESIKHRKRSLDINNGYQSDFTGEEIFKITFKVIVIATSRTSELIANVHAWTN